MKRQFGLIIVTLGSIVILVSFFLPWIEAKFVAVALPLIQSAAGLLNQELKEIITQLSLSDYSSLTGFDLAFRVNFVDSTVQLIVLLPVIVSAVALLIALLVAFNATFSRVAGITLAALAIITAITLVANIPSLSKLGLGDHWLTSAALSLLGFSPAAGFWGALGGVALIGIGAGILIFADSEENKNSYSYEESEYYGGY